ncbi:HAMP domain-containing histidine kinase [Dysgonomonas sp. OttesenSCG-928-M03]|nr:HAMP domain-containing histidine kinase [Dysgonomonas sp. OttesenSCG-928-M03]
MKSNFKYIVIGIITCLTLVFIWQLFWLKQLYHSIEKETENIVMECLDTSSLDELQYRIDSIESAPKDEESPSSITINHTFSDSEKEKEKNEKDNRVKKTKTIANKSDTVTTTEYIDNETFDIRMFDNMIFAFRGSLHQSLDSIAPINLRVLDSLIVVNLESKNITSKLYQLEIIDTETEDILRVSKTDSLYHGKSQTFVYTYDAENSLGYKIYVEPLTKSILMQMSGILATTALIIIILGFAFWYLIKTIIRQKTLEEMKDDFTNNMTHELKTPIAVAYSAADALLNFRQGDNKEKRDKYLTICKDQLSELTALVEQILSMSMERRRTFVLNKEDIHIKDIVTGLVDQHRLKASKNVNFNVDIQPYNLVINADKTHIANIISNLIDNAVKYSAHDASVDIFISQENGFTDISVKDNGIGISSEKQNYIFDKFYRVPQGNKHLTKGYGLGLFYVKTMVEKHGGTIAVSSTPGKGSTFTIKIPV